GAWLCLSCDRSHRGHLHGLRIRWYPTDRVELAREVLVQRRPVLGDALEYFRGGQRRATKRRENERDERATVTQSMAHVISLRTLANRIGMLPILSVSCARLMKCHGHSARRIQKQVPECLRCS